MYCLHFKYKRPFSFSDGVLTTTMLPYRYETLIFHLRERIWYMLLFKVYLISVFTPPFNLDHSSNVRMK